MRKGTVFHGRQVPSESVRRLGPRRCLREAEAAMPRLRVRRCILVDSVTTIARAARTEWDGRALPRQPIDVHPFFFRIELSFRVTAWRDGKAHSASTGDRHLVAVQPVFSVTFPRRSTAAIITHLASRRLRLGGHRAIGCLPMRDAFRSW